MGKVYGATETNVMIITARIIVTMKFADGIFASLFALLVCLFQRKSYNMFTNNIIFNAVSSFVIGVLICVCARMVRG